MPLVRRVRDAAEVEDRCAAHQPVAILVSSPLGEVGFQRRTRCWAVDEGTETIGLLTTARLQPGITTASAVAFDPSAAEPLADLVRRARVTHLVGGRDHVGPVAARFSGARSYDLELVGRVAQPLPSQPEARARVATVDDLPVLVDLYRNFELEPLADDLLREALDALVHQHRVVVAMADDGSIQAAMRVEARTRRWDLWGGLTVARAFRGQGLSRTADRGASELSWTAGRGTAGIRSALNHVPHDVPDYQVHPWTEVRIPVPPALPKRARRWATRQLRARRPA
ncbi:MAG: hypothetical protein ACTHN0_17780 [Aquihabitans sp.]